MLQELSKQNTIIEASKAIISLQLILNFPEPEQQHEAIDNRRNSLGEPLTKGGRRKSMKPDGKAVKFTESDSGVCYNLAKIIYIYIVNYTVVSCSVI